MGAVEEEEATTGLLTRLTKLTKMTVLKKCSVSQGWTSLLTSSLSLWSSVAELLLLLGSIELTTHTLHLPMAFYTHSLLYPIRAVCCSKLHVPKLPPDQCCIPFQATEATTRSVLYTVPSYNSLYPQCQCMYKYILPLTLLRLLVHFHLLLVHLLLHHLQLHLTYVQLLHHFLSTKFHLIDMHFHLLKYIFNCPPPEIHFQLPTSWNTFSTATNIYM